MTSALVSYGGVVGEGQCGGPGSPCGIAGVCEGGGG